MIVDFNQREEMENARLARISPEAYQAKMRAMKEFNLLVDLINFLKNLLAKMNR